MTEKIEISCPCCDATIVIDSASGQIVWHKEKARSSGLSFEAMVSEVHNRKSEAGKKLEREMEAQKDKSRLLDAKFKEALERAGVGPKKD
ncbi:MAG TPA: 2-nitropropane dioxygenase [Thermoanaerobaculia bacterium]|nr:2-nitropropane dioxygenase [Thermoanaerobaculia bacterium]